MQHILEAIQSGASGDELANLPIPESYRAAFVKREDVDMFEGVESWDKDPTKSLHVDQIATPELAPDEVYLAVMASSINFNTVWTSIFEPLPTFGFLERLGRGVTDRRCYDSLDELPVDNGVRCRRIERLIERDNAAERGDGIGCKGAPISLRNRVRLCGATGIGMFDNDAGRSAFKLVHALNCGIGIRDVVV